jgi:hypothetical protein
MERTIWLVTDIQEQLMDERQVGDDLTLRAVRCGLVRGHSPILIQRLGDVEVTDSGHWG